MISVNHLALNIKRLGKYWKKNTVIILALYNIIPTIVDQSYMRFLGSEFMRIFV